MKFITIIKFFHGFFQQMMGKYQIQYLDSVGYI